MNLRSYILPYRVSNAYSSGSRSPVKPRMSHSTKKGGVERPQQAMSPLPDTTDEMGKPVTDGGNSPKGATVAPEGSSSVPGIGPSS